MNGARFSPAADDIRVIVGDTHGDHKRMLEVLRSAGALDADGQRVPGFWLAHTGDVIHAGHGVQADDERTLALALELFDALIIGNHESPFLCGLGHFAGQNRWLSCQATLDRSFRDGRWRPALEVDGWLLTHGGLHPMLLCSHNRGARAFRPLRRTGNLDDASAVAAAINNALERRLRRREPEPLFDWCGPLRYGQNDCGGIFWCDWRELMRAETKTPSPVRQIVGHTPRRDVQVTADGRFWCVDVGAALSGYVGAIVKRPGEEQWTALRVGNGVGRRSA